LNPAGTIIFNFAANIRNLMKEQVKKILQKLLGFDRYLFIFSIYIIKTLRWNRNERDFLHFLKLIPGEGIVLDIGANIGIMSVWLGRSFPKSKIFSFEPIPQNIKTLRRVIRSYHLKNISVVEKALGTENRMVEMVMPIVNQVKMQGLSHVLHDSIDVFNEGNTFKVEMVRLDDFEPIHIDNLRITAIKLDVENFEAFVLDGAQQLIQKHRPVIYTELWENANRNQCFDIVKKHNYSIKCLVNGQLVDFEAEIHKTQNFFFIP
jgi:FkbM family methyltransferase